MILEQETFEKYGYNTSNLTLGSSRRKIIVQCDYCNEHFEIGYFFYLKNRKIIQKDCCKNCGKFKRKESFIKKYGVGSVGDFKKSKENSKLRRKPLKIGDKFGYWITISEPTYEKIYKHTAQFIMCKCECGKIKKVMASELKSGHTKSCGCQIKKTKLHHAWNGFEEISGRFFSSIKRGALSRDIEFNITIEQIWNLFLKQNRKCSISGVDLNFSSCARISDGNASLDRIDSTKGYIEGNIQWIHKDLNYMKQDFTEQEFFKWVKIIYNNQCNKLHG